jgi:hypothetical protein
MGINLISILEIVFAFIILPGAGFALTAGLITWKKELQKYIEGFTAIYLIYFLLVWLNLDSSWTSTPFLNIPIGNSPVMLIIYTVFGIGMLLGTITLWIRD